MNNRLSSALRTLQSALGPETLASFGQARLVKHLDGKIELLGGSPDDRRAAREWCSLFMHEAAIACSSPLPKPIQGRIQGFPVLAHERNR